MREGLRYIGLSLALGLIAVWGSENFFWSAPQATLTLPEFALTVLAYSACCACCLSAVIWSGCGGARGLFLAAAILGWLVEGVIVGTMYDVFPFQLVWTPLAWHGLITGVGVLGLTLASVRWRIGNQVAAMVGLGLFGALWATFWPVERDDQPAVLSVLIYLAGTGCLVVGAMIWIDRFGRMPRPPGWVLLVFPLLAAAGWIAGSIAAPSPIRLACPVLIGVTVWGMRRLGRPGGAQWPGPPALPWRHGVFLIAPLITTGGIALFWREPGIEVNWPVAAVTCAISVGWWLFAMVQAVRANSAKA
jgi:hypothetical protein